MFGKPLTFLLLFSLLACPVRCAIGSAVGSSGDSPAASACSCCQTADAGNHGTASEVPDPAENRCGCQNCVCEGAVSEGSSHRDATEGLTGFLIQFARVSHLLRDAGMSRGCELQGGKSPTGRAPAGRALRVAHQSLLI